MTFSFWNFMDDDLFTEIDDFLRVLKVFAAVCLITIAFKIFREFYVEI
jgi:hypothetical protein